LGTTKKKAPLIPWGIIQLLPSFAGGIFLKVVPYNFSKKKNPSLLHRKIDRA